jgi:two-component system, chemotaxis family, protein-glutamate methylesterase/glutaminase
MMLPVITGLGATEYIMAHYPTPILIVSSSTNRGELFKTYEALAAGALEVLEKPRGDDSDTAWERKFVAAVKLISRIRVITHPRARLGTLGRVPDHRFVELPSSGRRQSPQVIAVGASTGGPAAIVEILRSLPASCPLPLLLVLHIAEPFGTAFADWLDAQTEHRVAYARDGDVVRHRPGHVLMAPPGLHMVVRGGRVALTADRERHSCRPSVDVLFESLAREYGPAAVAVLLTGMGRDGAAGLLEVRRAGGVTMAQDEATSVVYGMPREAVLIGAAESILALPEIGPALASLARPTREAHRS